MPGFCGRKEAKMKELRTVKYTPEFLEVNGNRMGCINSEIMGEGGGQPINSPVAIYRSFIGDYPKFFKMDGLCKVGFIGAEFCLKGLTPEQKESCAIVLFNRGGSVATDRKYQQTIQDVENYFPSPALFVYTLANIVTGEIAIRHKIYGETSFYILDEKNQNEMDLIAQEAFMQPSTNLVLTGWVDYEDENDFEVDLTLYSR